MEQISFFLEKFKKLGLSRDFSIGAFISAVRTVTKVTLSEKSVTFKDGTFFVHASPALKSELFIKRSAILSELSNALGSKGERNIR